MKTRIVILLFLLLTISDVFGFIPRRARCDYTTPLKKITVWGGHGAFYVGTYIPLYATWYKPYGSTSFHFFNDNAEWRSMDKMGHAYTAFKLGSFSNYVLDWAYGPLSCSGLRNEKKKIWVASGYAMLYLTTLEVFDGFSNGWGFSWGDMTANTLGTGLFTAQKLWCREIFMRPKFSAHATHYANLRPEVLGASKGERILKDYNGQTYWLSIGLPASLAKWPNVKWAALSIGYGADGMTGGSYNPMVNENGESIPASLRTSSYYVSLDIDWERLPYFEYKLDHKNKKWLRILLVALNTVKLPFPALEFKQGGGVKLHALYF